MWLVMLSVNLRIRFDALTNFGVFFSAFFPNNAREFKWTCCCWSWVSRELIKLMVWTGCHVRYVAWQPVDVGVWEGPDVVRVLYDHRMGLPSACALRSEHASVHNDDEDDDDYYYYDHGKGDTERMSPCERVLMLGSELSCRLFNRFFIILVFGAGR